MEIIEISDGDLLLSSDKTKLNIDFIHSFLTTSYWSPGIPVATVEKAIANSLAFGLYFDGEQVGFCRIITDEATFAYLADVFITPSVQGKGFGKWMIRQLGNIEQLKGLRRWLLATKDAHDLYQNAGWKKLESPSNFLEIVKKNPYLSN